VIGFYPGLVDKDVPGGENPAMARTFLNQLVKVEGNYSVRDFKTPGWVHSTKKQWWSQLTNYVLNEFSDELKRLRLYEAVRSTCNEMEISVPNFYAILELYCPFTGIFFTPIEELGLALHEMWEVSKLPMGNLPYEEYFPCAQELQQLSSQNRALYETFRELMCHFQICLDINGARDNVNELKSRADYLMVQSRGLSRRLGRH